MYTKFKGGYMLPILSLFIIHWYLSLVVQTVFHHRYASHGHFTMSKRAEKVWHWVSWLVQGPSYLSPDTYGKMHRAHHSYSDLKEDPHSPKQDKNPLAMMWKTAVIYSQIFDGKHKFSDQFQSHLQVSMHSFDRFTNFWLTRFSFGALYFAIYFLIGPPWYMYLLLPIHWLMGPLHGFIVNWCGHKYGKRSFDTPDDSKNTLHVDLLMLGELYQNNHHANVNAVNFAQSPGEWDPGFTHVKLLARLGLINIKEKSLLSKTKKCIV